MVSSSIARSSPVGRRVAVRIRAWGGSLGSQGREPMVGGAWGSGEEGRGGEEESVVG